MAGSIPVNHFRDGCRQNVSHTARQYHFAAKRPVLHHPILHGATMIPDATIDTLYAIKTIDTLLATLNLKVDTIRKEIEQIGIQWVQLGRTGGQREDHAAALLANLTPKFETLAKFCHDVAEELKAIKENPFGEENDNKGNGETR
jgi:hypothetical protein